MQGQFSNLRLWLLVIGGAIAMFLSARFTNQLLDLGAVGTPVWLPAGIGLAALVLWGRRVWPGLVIGLFLAGLASTVAPSLTVPVWVWAAITAISSTVSLLISHQLLQRYDFDFRIERVQDVLALLGVGILVSPTVDATLSSLSGALVQQITWNQVGSHWWLTWAGDGMGILLLTPVLLTWLGRCLQLKSSASLQAFWAYYVLRWKAVETTICLLLLLLVSWIVFASTPQTVIAYYPLECLPFPLLVWAALRLGQRATVLSCLLVSSIAIGGLAVESGPFLAKSSGEMSQATLLLQTYVSVMTTTAIVLAAAIAERQHSAERFRVIFNGAAIGIGLDSLDGKIVESNPALQTMLGYNRDELSAMTFSDFTHPDDRTTDETLFQEMIYGHRDAYQIEKRHVRRDGEPIWVRLTNSLVRDVQGYPLFTIGMVENVTNLKQAEASVQLYTDVVKRMQLGLLVWQLTDLNDLTSFRLVECNPAACQILQVAAHPHELLGQSMGELFPELIGTAFPKIYADVIQSGEVRDLGEVRYCDRFVPHGVFATKAFPLPNRCVGLIFEDITERKQAEEALLHSEERFRVVAETAACAFLVYQGNHIRYANPAAEAMTGYSNTEIQAMNFWELAHPDHRELVKVRGLARQRGEAVPTRYDIKILTKQGQERWLDFTAGPIWLEGKPAALGTAYDITYRKQAEAQLRLTAERDRLLAEIALRIRRSLNLEEILNTTVAEVRRFLQADRVFIAQLEPSGCCSTVAEAVDPEWRPILGWVSDTPAADAIRKLFAEQHVRVVNDVTEVEGLPFLHDYYQHCQIKAGIGVRLMLEGELFGVLVVNQCSRSREWQPFEVDLLQQLGTQVEIAIQQGQLYKRVTMLANDLEHQVEERTAELNQRMQELQHTNQVKDILLHAVTHDLRTPAQGTLMVLNHLLSRCDDSVVLSRSMLERMIESSDRQLNLLTSLMESHTDQPLPISLDCQPLQLTSLIDTVRTELEPVLARNGVTLKTEIAADLPPVLADGAKLQQVVSQIISNAVKHNPPGITITVRAAVKAGIESQEAQAAGGRRVVYCQVQDNGQGMSPEQRDRVFKLYVRGLDNQHLTGIGLGLHRCHRIMTAHKGQIGVDSQPGQGTTVWFTLPVAACR